MLSLIPLNISADSKIRTQNLTSTTTRYLQKTTTTSSHLRHLHILTPPINALTQLPNYANTHLCNFPLPHHRISPSAHLSVNSAPIIPLFHYSILPISSSFSYFWLYPAYFTSNHHLHSPPLDPHIPIMSNNSIASFYGWTFQYISTHDTHVIM